MINTIFEILQSLCLIISAILILIASIGILRLKNDMTNVIYAKLHFLGIVDVAGVLAMIGLNQPLLAAIYFILAPIVGHAMANAYYYGEDEYNKELNASENNNSKNNNSKNNNTTKFKEEHIDNQDEQYSISKLTIINED
ncbi:MAG: monovalent cation/H(+) antiporter subunit G [Methanobrevibacter sp.]|jgi:energy-converting hydrogenase B subunit C|nr:monovalent cation/H(+) antiporter subunit G [Candidatus Methanovirga meridionalis]